MIPAAFGISSTIWESATFLLLVIPLTLLWVVSIVDTILRRDLLARRKILWLIALIPFPVVGTLFYVFRRPGLRERMVTVRESRPLVETRQTTVATLDNFAVTMDLTQLTLNQSAALLEEVVNVLSEAGTTASFTLPLTNIRPLGPLEVRVHRLSTQVRVLKITMERMSLALGMNARDLRNLARKLDTLGLPMDLEEEPVDEKDDLHVPLQTPSTSSRSSDGSVRIAVRTPGSDGGQPTSST